MTTLIIARIEYDMTPSVLSATGAEVVDVPMTTGVGVVVGATKEPDTSAHVSRAAM